MQTKYRKRIRALIGVALFIYLAVLAYVCFFSEAYGRTHISDTYRYNLKPFREIIRFLRYREVVGIEAFILNLWGNVLVFAPFGCFVPMLISKCRSGFKMIQLTFALSLFVETIQLISRVGSFDVDDLILNTLGGLLGYMVFKIFYILVRQKQERIIVIKMNDNKEN